MKPTKNQKTIPVKVDVSLGKPKIFWTRTRVFPFASSQFKLCANFTQIYTSVEAFLSNSNKCLHNWQPID